MTKSRIIYPQFFLTGLITLIFSSCNPTNSNYVQNIDIVDSIETTDDQRNNSSENERKDTLFSIFTTDMTTSQYNDSIKELVKRKSNFGKGCEVRKNIENILNYNSGNDNQYNYRNYTFYSMIFNNTPYYFEINVNVDIDILRHDSVYCPDDKIHIIQLQICTKPRENLIDKVIGLYSRKYSNYKKTIETNEFYGFKNGTLCLASKEDNQPLQSLTIIETYSWKLKPNLIIVSETQCDHTRKPINNYIYIAYYSNVYLDQIETQKKKKDQEKQKEEKERKKRAASLIDEI